MKKQIIQLLSNLRFKANYSTSELSPEIELIFITAEPQYKLSKEKTGVYEKNTKINECRLITDLDGINQMIGDLQLMASQLQSYDQLSKGINTLINQTKENKQEKK